MQEEVEQRVFTPTHFTKTIQFRDINYQLSDNEDKQAMENPEPFLSVQHLGADAQPFEVVEDVRFNAF